MMISFRSLFGEMCLLKQVGCAPRMMPLCFFSSGNQEAEIMSGKPKLYYFDGRGKMESIRWLLAAAGVEVCVSLSASFCTEMLSWLWDMPCTMWDAVIRAHYIL